MTSPARGPLPPRGSPPKSARDALAHQRGSEIGGAARRTDPAENTEHPSLWDRVSEPLGNTTKLPSAKTAERANGERRVKRRDGRYRLRDLLSEVTTLQRVGTCGLYPVCGGAMPTVRVSGSGDSRVAHFAGIQLCGNVHACPVCSPRIRQKRADDIDAGARGWIDLFGAGAVMLLTLTMPHDWGEPLADLLRTIRDSFSALVSGRPWQTDKANYGLKFYIVSHDVTVGRNGWHPHLHVLLFAERTLSDAKLRRLESRLHRRWSRAVRKRGHRAPSRKHGIHLERARSMDDVSRYVCQVVVGELEDGARTKPVALEMARGDLKTSYHEGQRTPWQVLSDLVERRFREGVWTVADDKLDDRDLGLWHEWERATKGLPSIRWAKGLRAAVGLGKAKTDEEIVAEEVGGIDVFGFDDANSWRAVATTPGARARVLAAAEDGGPIAIRDVVRSILARWMARRAALVRGPP